jgi:hypothetical protein
VSFNVDRFTDQPWIPTVGGTPLPGQPEGWHTTITYRRKKDLVLYGKKATPIAEATAKCHPNETFSKKVGVTLARLRCFDRIKAIMDYDESLLK